MRSSTRTKTVNASTNAKKDALAELTAARTAKEKRTQDQQQLYGASHTCLTLMTAAARM